MSRLPKWLRRLLRQEQIEERRQRGVSDVRKKEHPCPKCSTPLTRRKYDNGVFRFCRACGYEKRLARRGTRTTRMQQSKTENK